MDDAEKTAFIALGANLGDRESNIRDALTRLDEGPGVRVVRVSSLFPTTALVPAGAPEQPGYLNAAAALRTTHSARELLALMLDVERALGRDRAREGRWGARAIDLDLLLFAEEVIDEPGLVVPHPRMRERAFVLAPLAEIAPEAGRPMLGATAAELLARCAGDVG